MNFRTLLAMLISFSFLMVSCGTQATPEPTQAPTETLTPIPPTETPTLTPSPEPTSTPTATPTPVGGKDGLLLYQAGVDKDGNFEQKIFLYNLVSNELVPFLDGYAPLDVSPDGNQVLLIKYKNINVGETGDLFILNLAQPEKMTLLQENVEDAVWLGGSDWIGLIKVSGKRQGFIIHPDGSALTQITESSVGVVKIEPAFNDGIFWHEGTVTRRSRNTIAVKWTKLDGTETKFTNFAAVSPNGKYVITNSRSGQGFELIDIATSETREIFLSKSDPNINFAFGGFRPLSENKWLIVSHSPISNSSEYLIYFSDGTLLAKLPNGYRAADPSDPPQSYDLLSPDGVWILVRQFEKISDEQFKTTYYLFNVTTSEIKEMPSLYAIETGGKSVGNRWVSGEIEGFYISRYFWVEIP